MFDELRTLVDGWHEAAEKIEGYKATAGNGDGIQLMLLVNRTKDNGVRLTVVSVQDHFSSHSASDLLQRREDLDKSIPYASMTVPASD